jgi:hypothetical protein
MTLKTTVGVLALALAMLVAAPGALAEDSWEGLQKVPSKSLDEAWLMPGANFAAYTKVLLDPIQVSFRKGWERDVNRAAPPSARPRVTAEDAARIREWMSEDFDRLLRQDLKEAGFEIVTEPGTDVLRLTPVLTKVYLNGPDTMSQPGIVHVYTFEAGEATLAIEARDSALGTLLGRAVDRRRTGDDRVLQWTTEVSNRAEFGQLFRRWSQIVVDGLRALRMAPPASPDDVR